MNYELADKLCDADFPKQSFWTDEMTKEIWHFPTLSELIEACGDDFYSLYRHNREWQAHSNSDQWDTEIAIGETKEEAVAKLWLALQDNK